MSKATLTIPTPESCLDCPLKTVITTFELMTLYFCNHVKGKSSGVINYTDTRHPDCPLKIDEVAPKESTLNLLAKAIKICSENNEGTLSTEEINALLNGVDKVVQDFSNCTTPLADEPLSSLLKEANRG